VDSLRQCGIDDIIPLPQLVVCGDQSSGKSSVLEAITEIPFPRRENLCTRFATEIVLRRSPKSSIATKIIPDKARPAKEKKELAKFKLSITNFYELPDLIDSATKAMGLGDISSGTTLRAFTKDVLSIEICGPDRPQLTLVDLPGLIHSENQSQSRDDVILVSELVEGYIAESRTIILPIISAKNDYANQIILDRVRSVDPDGSRTLGIITKPDDLPPGSETEKSFVSLARNEEKVVTFQLGWHILKNRGFIERKHTFAQRNRSEASFFSKGVWAELPRDNVGIESLRTRLSELLFEHIKKELPDLRTELDKKLAETTKELQRLGTQRSTVDEQRQYLMKLSMSFYDIAKASLHGYYDAEYFADMEDFEDAVEQLKARRLRAMVQYMNKRFAARLRQYGHKYTFEGYDFSGLDSDDGDDGSNGDASNESEASSTSPWEPIVLGRREALDWVEQNLVQTRGREPAGNFNPLLIGELFWEQSENWEDIAQKHAEEISKLCTNFVSDLLQELCPQDVYARLSSSDINNAPKRRLEHSQAELKKIIADRMLYPMTYNHYYTITIQKLRSQRAEKNLAECIAEATYQTNYYTSTGIKSYVPVTVDRIDTGKLKRLCSERITLNMDDHSCNDALDCLYAYYKVTPISFA
jgi:GTPase SAR1 family protein